MIRVKSSILQKIISMQLVLYFQTVAVQGFRLLLISRAHYFFRLVFCTDRYQDLAAPDRLVYLTLGLVHN